MYLFARFCTSFGVKSSLSTADRCSKSWVICRRSSLSRSISTTWKREEEEINRSALFQFHLRDSLGLHGNKEMRNRLRVPKCCEWANWINWGRAFYIIVLTNGYSQSAEHVIQQWSIFLKWYPPWFQAWAGNISKLRWPINNVVILYLCHAKHTLVCDTAPAVVWGWPTNNCFLFLALY